MKGKIFNAQKVQAIISGDCTMFREVVKPQPRKDVLEYTVDRVNLIDRCPYKVGQEIFVKESFVDFRNNNSDIFYKHDFEINNGLDIVDLKWKPAQHMKQEHSRITLRIKEIRVERLADISEEDAIKEGATSRPNCNGYENRYNGWSMDWSKVGEPSKWASNGKTIAESDVCMGSAQYAFGNYWNATHKKPEHKFEANPWVFVYKFEVVK